MNAKIDPLITPDEELLTAEEVAAKFKVEVSWVYRAKGEGVKSRSSKRKVFLPFIQLGRYPRFRESDVREFIQSQSRNGSTQRKGG
jgi:predicted DNA-binding transcriptional regulator AlpA